MKISPLGAALVLAVAGAGAAAAVALVRADGARVEVGGGARAAAWDDIGEVAARVDAALDLPPDAPPAAPEGAAWTVVARRLSLGLAGTIPSLEEIRALERLPEPLRLDAWTDALLADERCRAHLAERIARALVGTADGSFVRFRRRRFVAWVEGSLARATPYDALVREAIAARGLWTDTPAANFLTQVAADDTPNGVDAEALTARVARGVLGVRMDCASCHDHPRARWTRDDFAGLRAFFAGTRVTPAGVSDVGDAAASPRVPFSPALLPASGPPRTRLAAWATSTRAFGRAAANRAWAWMFGRAAIAPVDDVGESGGEALDVLADDFRAHGSDLARMLRVIARTRAFRSADFPVTRLRAEQVATSRLQAASVETIGRGQLARLFVALKAREARQRYGDRGEEELDGDDEATLAQRLMVMNEDDAPLAGAARAIASAAGDEALVEAAFLVVLTRRPAEAEMARFAQRFRGARGEARVRATADLLAALRSTTEAAWNH